MMDLRRQKSGGVVGAPSEEEVLVPAGGIAGRGGQVEEEDEDVGQEHVYELLLHASCSYMFYPDRSVSPSLPARPASVSDPPLQGFLDRPVRVF